MASSLDDLALKIESTYEHFQTLIQRMEQHEDARARLGRASEEVHEQARATRELTSELHNILGNLGEIVSILRRSDPERTAHLIQAVKTNVEQVAGHQEKATNDVQTFRHEIKSQTTAVTKDLERADSSIQEARKEIVGHLEEVRSGVLEFRDDVKSQTTAITKYQDETSSDVEHARKNIVGNQQEMSGRIKAVAYGIGIVLVLQILQFIR